MASQDIPIIAFPFRIVRIFEWFGGHQAFSLQAQHPATALGCEALHLMLIALP
jgi:hypothetical protein